MPKILFVDDEERFRQNLAQRLALKHLRGKLYRGPVAGRPVPGVDPGDWSPPIADLEPIGDS